MTIEKAFVHNSNNIQFILDILWGAGILVLAGSGPWLTVRLFARIRRWHTKESLLDVETKQIERAAEQVKSILKFSFLGELTLVLCGLAGWIALVVLLPGLIEIRALGVLVVCIYALSFLSNGMQGFYERADAKGMEDAIKKAIESGDDLKAQVIVQGAWDTGARIWQYKAIVSATQIQSLWTGSFLEATTQETRYIVEDYSGEVINVYPSLTTEEGSEEDLHLDNLKKLMKMDPFWGWLALSSQRGEEIQMSEETIEGLNAKLEKAFLHQAQLVAAHPDTFCLEGLVRGVLKREREWKYIVNPLTGDYRHLKAGIHTVVGHIGPGEMEEVEAGTLCLPLWDAANNKAIPMELDAIAIVSGADFNYDWAVSASIEALRNRFPEKELKLDVKLDPALDLSKNSRALLREISILG